jgi:subtilisin family serine protease
MTASTAWRLAPVAIAALGSIAYLIAEPRTVDFAAGAYRTFLFDEEGLALWNGNWYSGHHVLGYSVLFPPLAWLVGTRVLGALAAVAAAALFESLVRREYGDRARWGALWFGAAATAPLWSGRIPFLLGATIGLGALLALQRGRRLAAAGLALACGLASPVAGLFLALVAIAYWLAQRRGRLGVSAAIVAAAVGPAVLIAVAMGNEGREPFDLSTFWPLPLLAIGFALVVPREERTLRIAALLYAAACVAAYLIDSPMGGNAARFAGFAGGPLLLCVLLARGFPLGRPAMATAVLVIAALSFIQWSPPVRDVIKAVEDPAVDSSYYAPLNAFLDRAGGPPARVEIPFTRSHWEAHEVGRHHPLARGWLRQADIERNGIFYGGALDSLTYGAWLSEHGVRWVALPDAKPDYSSYDERALIEAGLPYLKLRWRSDDWRVYEVTLPRAMVVGRRGAGLELERLGIDEVRLRAAGPGEATVRVAWSHFWKPDRGCVERDGEWTRVIADSPGPVTLTMDFAPGRIVSRGRRCA